MARTKPPLREAFNLRYRIEQATGCWIWTGDKTRGYGYYQIGKWRRADGSYDRHRDYAHRISWELHRGTIPDSIEVCHRCDVPLCVNPAHLFLGSHADNQADMAAKGRSAQGERQGRARLKEAAVREIMASTETGESIGRRFGVTTQTVNDIRCGRTWAHLGLTRSDNPKANQSGAGSSNNMARLNETDIPPIRMRLCVGERLATIAACYGVNEATIALIRDGKTWSHVK